MHHRRLEFETLGRRELLTSNLDSSVEAVVRSETFNLEAEEHHDSILLTNESTVMSRFTMRFNGNISVNTQDLVQQIREFEVPGQPDMPDYEKAYHYMLEYHAHDFPVSGEFWMHNPSLYLNSIGAGFCDDAASALKLIWNAMGYDARVWLLKGHVVSEVFTGERWQMYDADLRLVYYNHENGQVAGVEELAANPHYIYSPLQRFESADGSGTNHSKRTASFYWTTENNKICDVCVEEIPEHDLVFEIPAGGSLRVGELTPERDLPNTSVDETSLGLVTVTIPANSTGSLNIPLVLYDITGDRTDSVVVGEEIVSLGTDKAFEYFNNEQTGSRFESISYVDNAEPIEVHYLLNKKLTELLAQNEIEIDHLTDTSLKAEMVSPLASRWEFSDPQAGDVEGSRFDGTKRLDVNEQEINAFFDSERDFELQARIKVDANDASRRPLADSFRFSFEIDAQNRPYAYYRANNGRWVAVRGQKLPTDEFVDLSLRYDDGDLTLTVNGQVQATASGTGFDRGYRLQDLVIGGSDHAGGLNFKGHIDFVALKAVSARSVPWNTIAVEEAFAEPPKALSQDEVLADTNGDGTVEFADFALFTRNFGRSGQGLAGDLDSDGKVSFLDFFVFSRAFRNVTS